MDTVDSPCTQGGIVNHAGRKIRIKVIASLDGLVIRTNTMRKLTWTKPYCGVSHLHVDRKEYQYTLEDYNDYVPSDVPEEDSPLVFASKIDLERGTMTVERVFQTEREAKEWIEDLYIGDRVVNTESD